MKITLIRDTLVISFPRDGRLLNIIRSLPVRRFNASDSTWHADYVYENWDALKMLGIPLTRIKRPTRSAYSVHKHKKSLMLKVPGTEEDVAKARALPDTRVWSDDHKGWVVSPTPTNVRHILESWPMMHWSDDTRDYVDKVRGSVARLKEAEAVDKKSVHTVVTDYVFSNKPHPDTKEPVTPLKHQVKVFLMSRDREAFALHMEQGTGKSRVIVDTGCWLFLQRKITAVIVVTRNSMKEPWIDETDLMTSPKVMSEAFLYRSTMNRREKDDFENICMPSSKRLAWLVMNVESFSNNKGSLIVDRFMKKHKVLFVIDESTKIKSHSAKRSKEIVKLGVGARYRRILTGTPVTQGPLDLYMPFRFLDPLILGFGSYYSFRNRYAEMGGFGGKQIVHYRDLDDLQRKIEPHSFRILRSECLDLPPKQYQKLLVTLSPQARKIYNELRDEMITELSGVEVTVTMVITQLIRLQQIVGGFLPVENIIELENEQVKRTYVPVAIPGPNAKLDVLLDTIEDLSRKSKVIIWARFRAEIAIIAKALRKVYGLDSVVEFHGGVPNKVRAGYIKRFQDTKSPVRFFVGQTETGGMGITLTAASYVVYYSNSFSLESRLQSEDRAHRIGQKKSVVYIDLVAVKTIDEKLIKKLRSKKETANIITGDAWTEWL